MDPRFFLPFFVLFLCLVTVQSVIYQLKGQQVQFDPDITGQPKRILWKHNGDKVMEFNGNKEQVYGFYEGRVTLDWHSAKLQISDLCIEDSGEYEYDIYMEKFVFRKTYELTVIEKVAKPTITCQMNSSSSVMSAVLLCSVELSQPQSSLMFRWISKGNVQHGPQLTIFLGGKLDEEEYTCRVSNPVSYETATFIAKDCPTGSSGGKIAPIVFAFFLIVCVGLFVRSYRLKHKVSASRKKGQKTDLENPTSPEACGVEDERPPNETVDGNKKIVELKKTEQISDKKANVQRGLDKEAQDEEKRPLLEDQLTASSSQPQKQEDTDYDVTKINVAKPAGVSDGVTEDTESNQESNSAHKHKEMTVVQTPADSATTGFKKETTQDEEQRPLVEDPPTASSPQPQKQQDTENGYDRESGPELNNKASKQTDNMNTKNKNDVSSINEAEPTAVSVDVTGDTESDEDSSLHEYPDSEEEDGGAPTEIDPMEKLKVKRKHRRNFRRTPKKQKKLKEEMKSLDNQRKKKRRQKLELMGGHSSSD